MIPGRTFNSLSMKDEDFNTYKLKRLLQEQTVKNESLNEKNLRLNVQLKSLIALLQKKDDEIDEIFQQNSQKFVMRSHACRVIQNWIQGRLRIIKIETFEMLGGVIFQKILASGLLMQGILLNFVRKRKKKIIVLLKGSQKNNFKIFRMAYLVELRIIRNVFGILLENNKLESRKNLKYLKLSVLTQKFFIKNSFFSGLPRLYFHFWKKNKSTRSNYLFPLNYLIQSSQRFGFNKMKQFENHQKKQTIIKEKLLSEAKCKAFSQKFKTLNLLFLSLKNFHYKKKIFCFFKWKRSEHKVNFSKFLIILKALIKSRFSLFLKKATCRSFSSFLNLLNKKVTQTIKVNFQVLSNYSNIMSEEFLKFELQTLKTQSESSLSSLASLQLKLLDLNKQVMSFQLTFDQQEIIKKQKLIESNEQKRSLTEIGLELSKVESKIKETETENESKSRSYQESLEKIKKNMEQNNQKISKIEQNIDFYCVNIEKLEQEGTTAAFKLTQLESSYKKTQEILSNALNERNRFLAQDSELKKQKIILTGKIDSLAEEKEKMIEKLSQIKHEKTLAEQELKERAQESQELKEKLTEISTKLEILEDKKFRLSQQVDESFDLKENLLAHRQKELIKLKDHLSFNVTQVESLQKELNKIRAEDKENTLNLEYSQLLAKSEELKKELYSESQKYQNLSSNVSFLSQENEILEQELENLQDFIKESQLTHSTLKARLSELSVPSLNSSMEDNISSLKEYSFKLEAKINELTQKLSSNPGISRLATIKANLESKVKNLEEKLKECQEFAMKSRADVAEAITEIEHYAHLLNVLEEKMNETEEKVLICLREKEFAAEELKEVKDEYFGMIARR